MWGEGSLKALWEIDRLEEEAGQRRGKQLRSFLLSDLRKGYSSLTEKEKDYYHFVPPESSETAVHTRAVEAEHQGAILGRCPVASEKTRCCNLETLDAVKQCGYGCSYCSIQSFYDKGRIYFVSNLREKLQELDREMEEKRTESDLYSRLRHIGTGQSSDSLMWGNRNGLLEELSAFAARNPEVILELKTKSAGSSWLEKQPQPPNILATWSLNPQIIISSEEHLTASLDERLAAARRCADRGIPVGFHFHPMVRFKEWKREYGQLFTRLQEEFSPDEVVTISFGTLTFIKPVIKQLRQRKLKSKILQMPTEEIAGKLSYPLSQKEEMFSFAYNAFAPSWKEQVFFYLCMEDIRLWEPVFGRSYPNNEAFEADMKQKYYDKICSISHLQNK